MSMAMIFGDMGQGYRLQAVFSSPHPPPTSTLPYVCTRTSFLRHIPLLLLLLLLRCVAANQLDRSPHLTPLIKTYQHSHHHAAATKPKEALRRVIPPYHAPCRASRCVGQCVVCASRPHSH